MASTPRRGLHIIYNADGSTMGKIRYAYRKVTSDKESPACAACDITHAGLSLNETPSWVEAKKDIESSFNITVTQWHRDELSAQLRGFIHENHIALPVAIIDPGREKFQVVLDHDALASCRGDAALFAQKLKASGALE